MGEIRYDVEVEIFKGNRCDYHRLGETYTYPEDTGELYPWLLDSINSMIRVLQFGGSLPWTYKGSEYEKEIDPEGVTTEYIRCPDPTDAGIVEKVTRKKRETPKAVGWE